MLIYNNKIPDLATSDIIITTDHIAQLQYNNLRQTVKCTPSTTAEMLVPSPYTAQQRQTLASFNSFKHCFTYQFDLYQRLECQHVQLYFSITAHDYC